MATRREMDLDAALAALAREAHDTTPVPGPEMLALVAADAALTTLARETADAAPHPTDALVARVLSDAAAVAAERRAPPARRSKAQPTRGTTAVRGGLVDLLFGWRSGAVAALGLALAIGIGIGFRMEPGSLPMLDTDTREAAPVTLASLETDLLDVDGL